MASTLVDIIKKAAPILGAALGGVGAPIGMIVSGIASLFGGASSDDELMAKIKADPDAFLKLKQFEAQHEKDLLKFSNEDRHSARQRHVDTVRLLGKRDWVMDFLSVTPFVALTLLCCVAVFKNPVGPERDFFYAMFDMFSSFLAFVMGYHFGGVAPKKKLIFTKEDKS